MKNDKRVKIFFLKTKMEKVGESKFINNLIFKMIFLFIYKFLLLLFYIFKE